MHTAHADKGPSAAGGAAALQSTLAGQISLSCSSDIVVSLVLIGFRLSSTSWTISYNLAEVATDITAAYHSELEGRGLSQQRVAEPAHHLEGQVALLRGGARAGLLLLLQELNEGSIKHAILQATHILKLLC
jgi:hypothetical protein